MLQSNGVRRDEWLMITEITAVAGLRLGMYWIYDYNLTIVRYSIKQFCSLTSFFVAVITFLSIQWYNEQTFFFIYKVISLYNYFFSSLKQLIIMREILESETELKSVRLLRVDLQPTRYQRFSSNRYRIMVGVLYSYVIWTERLFDVFGTQPCRLIGYRLSHLLWFDYQPVSELLWKSEIIRYFDVQ